MKQDPNIRSYIISIGLHALIIACLIFSFERTKALLPSPAFEPNKPIVEAVMVNEQVVQKEVQRLANIEKAKIEREKARQREIIQKREKEEALLIELKQKNEQLKKEAQAQHLAKIKREKEEKAEKEAKAKAEKAEKAEREKKEKQAKEEALAQQKKIEAERKAAEEMMLAQANSHARNEYQALIRSILHQNWTKPTGFDLSGLSCVVLVDLLPTGEVVRVSVSRSSGNITFDRSTEVAVYKSSPLPMPKEPRLAEEARQFEFKFNPEAA